MIKHIVSWKLQEENQSENATKVKVKLEGLIGEIAEIIELEVGIDFNESEAAHDVLLYSTFATKEDLNAYQIHPLHVEAATFIKSVVTGRVVVDYEV
jgi:transcriptional antiterminator